MERMPQDQCDAGVSLNAGAAHRKQGVASDFQRFARAL